MPIPEKTFTYTPPKGCTILIKGFCRSSIFDAGIESYYASKEKIEKLGPLLNSKNLSVVLSVLKDGQAQVKDIVIR